MSVFFHTQSFNVQQSIKILKPDIKQETVEMIAKVINTKAFKYGMTVSDYPVIIAMMSTESNFKHIKGTSGEVGMLQVIPTDGHIKRIVAKNIRCKFGEKWCNKNNKPNIYYNRGKIASYKVRRFLWDNPIYAIEVGIAEMQFWRAKWKKYLKRKYWVNFPSYYYKKSFGKKYLSKKSVLTKWWYNIKEKGGSLLWVSAYNWGGSLAKYSTARNYPLRVLVRYNKMLGRKRYAKYTILDTIDSGGSGNKAVLQKKIK